MPAEKIIEAHGSFATQRCIECKTEFPDHLMTDHVFKGQVPRCNEEGCVGTVKPDIVFFGEALPSIFRDNAHQTAMADLVLILGTSLTVHPFAGLPEMVRDGKPRVLFNMERVGQLGRRADDVLELGSCDAGIRKLADELGWRDELEEYWRKVVGHEEAERQVKSAKEEGHEVEDEVQKLTEGVESALRLNGDSEDEAGPSNVEGADEKLDAGRSGDEHKDDAAGESPSEKVGEPPKPELSEDTTKTVDEAPATKATAETDSQKPVDAKIEERETEKSTL